MHYGASPRPGEGQAAPSSVEGSGWPSPQTCVPGSDPSPAGPPGTPGGQCGEEKEEEVEEVEEEEEEVVEEEE